MRLLLLSIPQSDYTAIDLSITRQHTPPFPTVASDFSVPSFNPIPIRPIKGPHYHPTVSTSQFPSACTHCRKEDEADPGEAYVQDLRVPDHWLLPSKALEESEWLRITLHKWLDDEYCPEKTNVEISKIAAQSYYESLLEKRTDLGDILLKMARELTCISYQESFHGAFSSANAAVNLIAHRIELEGNNS
uniref:Uncharacterized protein n=1 Tax=Rhizophora mucronata TaxID=61149 RepID=A0A2P2MI35_RHIMU